MYLSIQKMASLVTELSEDLWNKRSKLITKDRSILYFPFRISVGDTKSEANINFYLHLVIGADRFWYTISDLLPYEINCSSLIFEPGDETTGNRGTSYRRYLFQDIMVDDLREKIQEASDQFKNPTDPFLWDTFPLTDFRG